MHLPNLPRPPPSPIPATNRRPGQSQSPWKENWSSGSATSWVFTNYDEYAPDLEYGIAPGPVFDGRDEHCNYDGGGSWFIFKEGGQSDMSWKFIETIMLDENLIPLSDQFNLLPGTKTASEEYAKLDERRPVFVETANTVKWIPVFSGTLETLSAVATAFDNILIGGAEIESELAAAQDKMQVILDRHNSFPVPTG